jgi:protein-tyrosine kinase
MSWFYEALQRAEKERPKSKKGTNISAPGQEGESFLAPIESLQSVAAKGSAPMPAMPSSATLSTVEDIPAHSPESLNRIVRSKTLPLSEGGKSPNGFRHLTLPLREESRLVFQTDPHGVPAEQFRLLRRTLKEEFAAGGVLVITSPGKGDGKTLTSLNLCACLADSRETVLLVEADVRRPAARNILGNAIEPPGIEDAWAEKVEPRKTVHLIEELSLHAALVAKVPDDPSRLINGPGVKKFFAWARENFRWVVIDAPPLFPAADVAELLPLADAALLVIRAESTPRELSRRAFEVLGTRLHGVIFNAAAVDSSFYYSYSDASRQGASIKKAGLKTGNNGK